MNYKKLINSGKLKYAGNGAYGFVYTDNLYAYKFGRIRPSDVSKLKHNQKRRLSVPIHYYNESIAMPKFVIDDIFKYNYIASPDYMGHIPYFHKTVDNLFNLSREVRKQSINKLYDDFHAIECDKNVKWYCSLLIMAKAENTNNYSDDELEGTWDTLRRKVKRLDGYWYDRHAGNIGFYRGRPVILDI